MTAQNRTTSKHQKVDRQSSNRQSSTPKAIPNGHKGRVRRRSNSDEMLGNREIQADMATICINCGGELLFVEETRLCPKCNSEASITMIRELSLVVMTPAEMDRGFIECPGATLFDPETREPIEGAVFGDDTNEGYSVKHVKWPVFPPGHKKRRMIPTEAYGKIRRCRACQDYTVRMRRKEGADFCAPSAKFPHRKRLKSVDFVGHRQPL